MSAGIKDDLSDALAAANSAYQAAALLWGSDDNRTSKIIDAWSVIETAFETINQ